MLRVLATALAVISLTTATLCFSAPTPPVSTPGMTVVGKGLVSGSALDTSGLAGNICQAGAPANCVPKAIFGGFGSDLTYTGHDNVFIAAPDRGPFDGLTDVPYLDRFYFLHITTDVDAAFAFGNRLEPEGIRVAPDGTFYVSDEYGPYIFRFNRQGHLLRRIELPSKFAIANPNADPNQELLGNTAGRQANRGMEGLAISPDGSTLFGIMQNALLQDHGLNPPPSTDRLGLNNRILKVDLATGETHEYVYVLDAINRGQGVCEILAINDHEFLVVERDNRSNLQSPPQAPTRKTIYKINLTGATDVSGIDSLPAGALPAGVTPATKSLFINLLDADLNMSATIPEKIEGLSWGPDLSDGRHLLYVVSDNDLNPTLATQIYAFAIEPALLNFQEQILPEQLFPTGQVKKLIK